MLLQGCVGGETGYCSETCVTGGVGGTGEGSVDGEEAMDIKGEVSIDVEDPLEIKEEFSIKVEEAIDIKEEMPEDTYPPINMEPEVRLWVVYVSWLQVLCVRW
jgi:hypothetical protein